MPLKKCYQVPTVLKLFIRSEFPLQKLIKIVNLFQRADLTPEFDYSGVSKVLKGNFEAPEDLTEEFQEVCAKKILEEALNGHQVKPVYI